MQSALFVGRFQPFHKGHLDVIRQILEQNERVIIAIGSAEKNFLPDNPLTASERFQLIEESLKEFKVPNERFCIIPIRNVNNYAIWVNHINIYLPPYNKVYTGSKIVKACYEDHCFHFHKDQEGGPKIVQLKRILPISATKVRENIMKKKKWEHLVPAAAVKLLKKWRIENRLGNVQDTMDFTRYNNEY